MSSPSAFVSPSDGTPPSLESAPTPPHRHLAAHSPTSRSAPQSVHTPRLSTPRFLDNLFPASPDSARDAHTHTQVPASVPRSNIHDPVQNFSRALLSANRALQNAQEAFHQARLLQTDPRPNEHFVDLTANSPPSHFSESHFISHTTHGHDSPPMHRPPRRMTTLDEPVYEFHAADQRDGPPLAYHATPSAPAPPNPDQLHLMARRHRIFQSMMEAEAIDRQRQNHYHWRRTQERNLQTAANMPPPTSTSPPASSSSLAAPARERRQHFAPPTEDPTIESLDLTAVDDSAGLSVTLAKQREDAILAQNHGSDAGRTPLTAYKCPICMDTPTNATSTVCGHVFCHECIMETLNWSMEQRREGMPTHRKVKGVCPVCRKVLDTKDSPGTTRSLVPLELKLMVRKRKRDDKGKDKEPQKRVKAESVDDGATDRDDTPGPRNKDDIRAGKARRRETTEEALWDQFMAD